MQHLFTFVRGLLLGALMAAGTAFAAPAAGPADKTAAPQVVPGEWVDLLQKMNAAKNTVSGNWGFQGAYLANSHPRFGRRSIARIALPSAPKGSFDLEFTYLRGEGNKEFCVIFPVAGHSEQLWIGGMLGQDSSLEGLRVTGDKDHVKILNNKDQTLLLRVIVTGEEASISVSIDGTPYMAGTAPLTSLRVNEAYALLQAEDLGFAVHSGSVVGFKAVKMRPLAPVAGGGGAPAPADGDKTEAPQNLLPVPSLAAVAAAQKTVRSVFDSDCANRSPAGKRALAVKRAGCQRMILFAYWRTMRSLSTRLPTRERRSPIAGGTLPRSRIPQPPGRSKSIVPGSTARHRMD